VATGRVIAGEETNNLNLESKADIINAAEKRRVGLKLTGDRVVVKRKSR
jgi:hypothetical protein